MVITATCPACHSEVRRWMHLPFVYFRTRCECGTPLVIKNPKVPEKYIQTARRCLDCGDPIAPVVPKGRTPRFAHLLPRPQPWVCRSCWERHRVDEPGTNLDMELVDWLNGQVPMSLTRSSSRRV
jgi:hypothetical protein